MGATNQVTVRQAGRPTDCTPEVVETICAELRAAMTIKTACSQAGVSVTTYHNWLHRGEAGEEPFLGFLKAVTRAKEDGIRALAGTIRKEAVTDWRAAAWMLERRDPDEWSRRTELTGKSGGPVEVREVKVVLTTEAEADIFDGSDETPPP